MATETQTRANQQNARKSTGPRTEAGKAKSSQNALKHGLRAQATVLPNENPDEFDTLVAELEDQFQPETALEWTLLRQLADAEWRMRRVPIIEAGVMSKHRHELLEHYDCYPGQLPEAPDEVDIFLVGAVAARDARSGDVFAKLSRYESRLSHRYFKALEHLTRLNQQRQKSKNSKPPSGKGDPACGSGTGNPACESAVRPAVKAAPMNQTNPIHPLFSTPHQKAKHYPVSGTPLRHSGQSEGGQTVFGSEASVSSGRPSALA